MPIPNGHIYGVEFRDKNNPNNSTVVVNENGEFQINNVPNTNPNKSGKIFSQGGALRISQGPS